MRQPWIRAMYAAAAAMMSSHRGAAVDPGDEQALVGDEPVIGRALGAGRPELFGGVHGAVVALDGLDLVQGRGGHALVPATAASRSATTSVS
ncbi:hypothetical protein [Streptomyces griseofuscus]|uniref:hypothetical protein n=1 Tax=Streptomyces griseofuscus TaxID=146922 RepID=UPI0033D64BB1